MSENVSSPATSEVNTSTEVGQFQLESGVNSRIEFELTQNITDISAFEQKVNVYLDAELSSVSNKRVRVYLLNSSLGYGNSIHKDFTLIAGEQWLETLFDFSEEEIPTEVIQAGGFDRVAIMFAPGDTETSGTVYYFDNLRGTIPQPPYVAPEVFYDWFDYGMSSAIANIDFSSKVGGAYEEIYQTGLDGVLSSDSESGEASKFIKVAGEYQFAQVRYDFEDGAIEDEESITFRLNTLFKPESTTEINVLDENTRAIRLYMRDNQGGTGNGQLSSTVAYFTQTNDWETLEFTFESENLMYYDQLIIMVTPGYTNAIDENGNQLEEDLVYYFESLTANENIGEVVTSVENDLETEASFVYPNPTNGTVTLSATTNTNYEVYNSFGELMVQGLTDSEDYKINLATYSSGVYFIRFISEGNSVVSPVIKK